MGTDSMGSVIYKVAGYNSEWKGSINEEDPDIIRR